MDDRSYGQLAYEAHQREWLRLHHQRYGQWAMAGEINWELMSQDMKEAWEAAAQAVIKDVLESAGRGGL